MSQRRDSAHVRNTAHLRNAVVAATLGFAAASWVVAVRQMHGMNMGIATTLGSFGFFVVAWVSMMAAMMLPGAVPAVVRRAEINGHVPAVLSFVVAYLAVWATIGVVVFAFYQPHGTTTAGVVVIAAGVYELTPVKKHCRRRCRENMRSGFEFGLYCVGSSIGLMLVLLALGVMSIAWMIAVAVVVLAQKLAPATRAIDVALAVAIVALGILVVVAPSSVPGLMPSM